MRVVARHNGRVTDWRAVIRDEIRPRAAEMDRSEVAVREGLGVLARHRLLALKRPETWGGPALPEPEFREFQEEIARASGTLAFLQTQHQSAVGMIATSPNETLKEAYLPRMSDGERLVGIGFSQLRRSGPPLVTATPTEEGGYRVSGHVPWVTGEGYFPEFLLGASLESGEAVFLLAPLTRQAGVTISEPMSLLAMETARTVTVDFENVTLSAEKVAFIRPRGWIADNDEINLALQGAFAMGCARGGLDILLANAERRGAPALRAAWTALDAELETLRTESERLRTRRDAESVPQRLALRAQQIELCQRCAAAAVTSSSGAANGRDHPAGRVWRESLVYTVIAQTEAIMGATLARLARIAE